MEEAFASTHEVPVAAVLACCQRERRFARLDGHISSPCCVELFRRAFRKDNEAWTALLDAFAPLLQSWLHSFHDLEPEDALQDALLEFSRYAPAHTQLVAGDHLGPVLTYLRSCVKTASIARLRKRQRWVETAPLEEEALPEERASLDEIVARRLALRQILAVHLVDEPERLVFRLYFELNLRAQEIADAHLDLFADASAVYLVVQRIQRRLRKDKDLQELRGES